MFQFQMVRLKSNRSAIPNAKFNQFQFQMVRLKLAAVLFRNNVFLLFQFQMVRLKYALLSAYTKKDLVSIPNGSIKMLPSASFSLMPCLFQFQMVRLKCRR